MSQVVAKNKFFLDGCFTLHEEVSTNLISALNSSASYLTSHLAGAGMPMEDFSG